MLFHNKELLHLKRNRRNKPNELLLLLLYMTLLFIVQVVCLFSISCFFLPHFCFHVVVFSLPWLQIYLVFYHLLIIVSALDLDVDLNKTVPLSPPPNLSFTFCTLDDLHMISLHWFFIVIRSLLFIILVMLQCYKKTTKQNDETYTFIHIHGYMDTRIIYIYYHIS